MKKSALSAGANRDMAILEAHRMPTERAAFAARRDRAAAALGKRGLAALLLSPGSDLAYLSGYRIFGTERLTCLVIDANGRATLVVPTLESPRATAAAPDLVQGTWEETEDPYALVAALVTSRGDVAVADQMWALFTLRLQQALPGRAFSLASVITRELRVRKDAHEREALRAVSASADRAYRRVLECAFAGRRERDVASDLAGVRRRRVSRRHRRGRLRQVLHPSHRARHRTRRPRTPVPRARQRRNARAGHGVLDRARHLPAGTLRRADRGHRDHRRRRCRGASQQRQSRARDRPLVALRDRRHRLRAHAGRHVRAHRRLGRHRRVSRDDLHRVRGRRR